MLKVMLHLWGRGWGGCFPGGTVVKNQPANEETQVRSLGGEDPLEEEMETHSSILAWKMPWTEEPGRLQSIESQRVRHKSSNRACMHTHGRYVNKIIGT